MLRFFRVFCILTIIHINSVMVCCRRQSPLLAARTIEPGHTKKELLVKEMQRDQQVRGLQVEVTSLNRRLYTTSFILGIILTLSFTLLPCISIFAYHFLVVRKFVKRSEKNWTWYLKNRRAIPESNIQTVVPMARTQTYSKITPALVSTNNKKVVESVLESSYDLGVQKKPIKRWIRKRSKQTMKRKRPFVTPSNTSYNGGTKPCRFHSIPLAEEVSDSSSEEMLPQFRLNVTGQSGNELRKKFRNDIVESVVPHESRSSTISHAVHAPKGDSAKRTKVVSRLRNFKLHGHVCPKILQRSSSLGKLLQKQQRRISLSAPNLQEPIFGTSLRSFSEVGPSTASGSGSSTNPNFNENRSVSAPSASVISIETRSASSRIPVRIPKTIFDVSVTTSGASPQNGVQKREDIRVVPKTQVEAPDNVSSLISSSYAKSVISVDSKRGVQRK